jgi:hypothetical protein
MGRRLLTFGVVLWSALAGVVTIQSSAAAADCVVDEILVNSCRPWLGATAGKYPQVSSGFRSQIAYHEQRIGRPLDIVHTYHPPGDMPLTADERYYINRADTISFINWKPTVRWIDAAGGNATVNAQIDQVADAFLSVAPNKVMLTLCTSRRTTSRSATARTPGPAPAAAARPTTRPCGATSTTASRRAASTTSSGS